MAELVDVQDLGSCGAIRVGSTPTTRTRRKAPVETKLVSDRCFLQLWLGGRADGHVALLGASGAGGFGHGKLVLFDQRANIPFHHIGEGA